MRAGKLIKARGCGHAQPVGSGESGAGLGARGRSLIINEGEEELLPGQGFLRLFFLMWSGSPAFPVCPLGLVRRLPRSFRSVSGPGLRLSRPRACRPLGVGAGSQERDAMQPEPLPAPRRQDRLSPLGPLPPPAGARPPRTGRCPPRRAGTRTHLGR